MKPISLTIDVVSEQNETVLIVKVMDSEWMDSLPSRLLTEVGESLVRGSYKNFRFDLSALKLVSSVTFSAISNIAATAEKNKKTLEIVLNSEAAETARIASLDKIVRIVEV